MIHVLILANLRLFAQTTKVVRDFRSRAALCVEKEVFNKFLVTGEAEVGFEHNLSSFEEIHGEVGLKYNALDCLNAEFNYRFLKDRKKYTSEFENANVYSVSVEALHKFNDLKGSYRLQYQNEDEEDVDGLRERNHHLVRNRIKLKYHINQTRISPYFSSEFYVRVAKKYLDAKKIRFVTGASINLKKKQELDLYFRADQELAPDYPCRFYTLGVTYQFNL
ncbi:MAG TPA: DUF2490 domain-containing protein [Prolixibacteraceae bacterium]|nr:DUF2490 domain-containing protein [Prolixibacteraceae bacterium]